MVPNCRWSERIRWFCNYARLASDQGRRISVRCAKRHRRGRVAAQRDKPTHIHRWRTLRLGTVFRAAVTGAFASKGANLLKINSAAACFDKRKPDAPDTHGRNDVRPRLPPQGSENALWSQAFHLLTRRRDRVRQGRFFRGNRAACRREAEAGNARVGAVRPRRYAPKSGRRDGNWRQYGVVLAPRFRQAYARASWLSFSDSVETRISADGKA